MLKLSFSSMLNEAYALTALSYNASFALYAASFASSDGAAVLMFVLSAIKALIASAAAAYLSSAAKAVKPIVKLERARQRTRKILTIFLVLFMCDYSSTIISALG